MATAFRKSGIKPEERHLVLEAGNWIEALRLQSDCNASGPHTVDTGQPSQIIRKRSGVEGVVLEGTRWTKTP